MRVREKGKKDADAVHMDFGQAQAALASGSYELVEEEGEPGPEIHGGVWGNEPAPIEAKPAGQGEPDYDAMTRAELDKLAAERGVDVSKAGNKAEVIAALKAA